jgi:uncharacterized membrane protein
MIFALGFRTIRVEAHAPVVRAVLFYSPSCSHCHHVITEVLPPLQQQYGTRLEILQVDVQTDQGDQLFLSVMKYYGLESTGVPFLLIGNRYLIGSVEIPEKLPGLIDQYLGQGGVDWPAVPGLRESLGLVGAPAPESSASGAGLLARITANVERDPLGNAISIIVLLGMVVSMGAAVAYARKLSIYSRARIPAWVIPVMCLLGLVVAGYLSYVEVGRVEAVCGPIGDCNTVQQSAYARLFGILPIGVLGIFGYALILTAWFLARTSGGRLATLAGLSIFGMTTFGFLFSIYLTFLEPFVIGASCAWCLTSAVLMTALFWLSLRPGKTALSALAPNVE